MAMTSVEVHPLAQLELREGIRWYAERSERTARRFAVAVKSRIAAIQEHPEQFPSWDENYRFCLVPGFPYFIAYRLTSDSIIVAAIRHTSRDQDEWLER
jgi:plasmid stabilization system protein ParE